MEHDAFILTQMSHAIVAAIAERDIALLGDQLAPGFTYRGGDGSVSDAAAFLDGIRHIPGDIVFVRIETVAVDVFGPAAMVTGIQHAQVRVEGQTVDDRRAFADFFVKVEGVWKLRAGADFPATAATAA